MFYENLKSNLISTVFLNIFIFYISYIIYIPDSGKFFQTHAFSIYLYITTHNKKEIYIKKSFMKTENAPDNDTAYQYKM